MTASSWLAGLRDFLAASARLQPPADSASLAQLEAELGLELAPSHRAFLAFADGASDWGLYGEIYSCERIRQAVREQGFAPGNPSAGGIQGYYAAKPLCLLPIAGHPLGADIWCLDTSKGQSGSEYPVTHYDAEFDTDRHLRPRFPDFDTLLRDALDSLYEAWLEAHEDGDPDLEARLEALRPEQA